MTRKDYALIAGALRDVQPSIEAFHEYGVWQECVKRQPNDSIPIAAPTTATVTTGTVSMPLSLEPLAD